MNSRRPQGVVGRWLAVLLVVLVLGRPGFSEEGKEKLTPDKLPKNVLATLEAKFPRAEVQKCTREKEGDTTVYDIEFKQGDQKFEADIKEDGTIHNWEKEITAKDLPAAVKKTVDARYPRATMREVMMVTAVKDGKDELEGYEIVLETVDKKGFEIMVAPDGKILEEEGL